MTSRPGRLDRRHMGQAGDLVAQVLHDRATQLKQEARERKPIPSTTGRPAVTVFRRRWPLPGDPETGGIRHWPLPGDPETGSVPRPRTHRARPNRRRWAGYGIAAAGWLIGMATNIVDTTVRPIGDIPYVTLAVAGIAMVLAGLALVVTSRRRTG